MKKIFQRIIAAVLCLTLLAVPVAVEPETAEAASNSYLNKCLNSMVIFENAKTGLSRSDIMGIAYLVGSDNVAGKSWLATDPKHDAFAVDPDLKINGKSIDPKYLVQDNRDYLISIKEEYLVNYPMATDSIYSKAEGFQCTFREGTKFYVFDCDEEWVTVYDDGFQTWNYETGLFSCGSGLDSYLETHPAGFYKIRRENLWIDFGLKENHPWKSESEIPNKGTGITTGLVALRPVPDESEKVYTPVYYLPTGTKVTVVSTELVPSKADGSTRKFYKVAFNGSDKVQNNAVYYLAYKTRGMYYIDSRYLDFTKKGASTAKDSIPVKFVNNKSTYINAYESKDTDSKVVGRISKNYKNGWYFPSESDKDWSTIWFSGQKVYVQSQYVTKGSYKVTDISGLKLADTDGKDLIYTWKKGVNNVDFSCQIIAKYGYLEKVIYSDDHVKEAKLRVTAEQLEEADGHIEVTVQANNMNGGKGKKLSKGFLQTHTSKVIAKYVVAKKTKIEAKYTEYKNGKRVYPAKLGTCIQISTDKNFKKARTIEKPYKEDGVTKYEDIYEIGKLKPNTTYYIRRCYYKDIYTAAGKKPFPTKWSEPVKIKTKK